MKKHQDSTRIDLIEPQQPKQPDKHEPKDDAQDLELSELESRIAPLQVGTFF